MQNVENNSIKEKTLHSPLGLALSGGGVKGFAHLGVLKYFEEKNIKPQIISGTSAGSLMGSLYADGFHPEEIAEMLGKLTFRSMTNFTFEKGGLFDVSKLHKLLKNNLRHKNIEDLPIPVRIVATDIDNGVDVVFSKGNLLDSIIASCSIPVLFKPMLIDGVHYVDGGLLKNLPASAIRQDCKTLIGVDLNPNHTPEYRKNIIGVSQRSIDIILRQNSIYDRQFCDIILESTKIYNYGMFEFKLAFEAVECGYDMAKEKLSCYFD